MCIVTKALFLPGHLAFGALSAPSRGIKLLTQGSSSSSSTSPAPSQHQPLALPWSAQPQQPPYCHCKHNRHNHHHHQKHNRRCNKRARKHCCDCCSSTCGNANVAVYYPQPGPPQQQQQQGVMYGNAPMARDGQVSGIASGGAPDVASWTSPGVAPPAYEEVEAPRVGEKGEGVFARERGWGVGRSGGGALGCEKADGVKV